MDNEGLESTTEEWDLQLIKTNTWLKLQFEFVVLIDEGNQTNVETETAKLQATIMPQLFSHSSTPQVPPELMPET